MRINRGLLFWGLGFVTAGVVALAIQQGILDRDTMAGAWRLWPLILVAIGISLIVARTPAAPLGTALAAIVIGTIVGTAIAVGPSIAAGCGSGSEPTALDNHTGTFGSDAVSLDWRLNCGTLEVSTSGDSGWQASVGSTGSNQPAVTGSSGQLRIESADTNGWFPDHGRERWVVTLPTAPAYDANVQGNAGTFTLNLAGATFSSLSFQPNAAEVHLNVSDAAISDLGLELNAGSANITASSGTLLEGSIQVNAGSVKLCVPSGVPVRITADGTAFSATMGGNGLTQDGNTWTSAGYDPTAAHRITLSVHGNAASFDLNPDGGCK